MTTHSANQAAHANQADFHFACPKYPGWELRVLRFSGHEEISTPFAFDITLVTEQADLDLDALIGLEGVLRIKGEHGSRYVHGLIERFMLISMGRKQHLYQARLVASLQLMEQVSRARVFQDLSIPDILQRIWRDAGLPPERLHMPLCSRYDTHALTLQYHESDLHFLSRLLEDAGIFYYFEHSLEKHLLILGDTKEACDLLPVDSKIQFQDESLDAANSSELFYSLQVGSIIRPGKVTLRDHRFQQPHLGMESSQQTGRFDLLEVYHWPGGYDQPDAGRQRAMLRLGALQSDQHWLEATGTCRNLLPGYRFTLVGHPRAELNREYLLVSVQHDATQTGVLLEDEGAGQVEATRYTCKVRFVPSDTPYRPPLKTSKPVARGIELAVVVGPKSEGIHCDEHGRIRVQFLWDREHTFDESSSSWIRVAAPWAGVATGIHFLPRVGQEVIVQFLDGDPDRPVVIGSLHNGANPTPYPLPQRRTTSAIRTASFPGGKGFNELRFEDQAGKEEVRIHAQRNLQEDVLKDRLAKIGGDDRSEIGGARSSKVKKNMTADAGGDISFNAAKSIHLSAGKAITLTAAQGITLKVGASTVHVGTSSVSISSPRITSSASGPNIINGAVVLLNCGGGGGGGDSGGDSASGVAAGQEGANRGTYIPHDQRAAQYAAYYKEILLFCAKEEVLAKLEAIVNSPTLADQAAEYFEEVVESLQLDAVKESIFAALREGRLPTKEELKKAGAAALSENFGGAVGGLADRILPSDWPKDVRSALIQIARDGTQGAVNTALLEPEKLMEFALSWGKTSLLKLAAPLGDLAEKLATWAIPETWAKELRTALIANVKEGVTGLLTQVAEGPVALAAWLLKFGWSTTKELAEALGAVAERHVSDALPKETEDMNWIEKQLIRRLPGWVNTLVGKAIPKLIEKIVTRTPAGKAAMVLAKAADAADSGAEASTPAQTPLGLPSVATPPFVDPSTLPSTAASSPATASTSAEKEKL